MIVPITFLVIVVVMPLGLAFLAFSVGNNAQCGSLTNPQVCPFTVGGDEVLRLALDGL